VSSITDGASADYAPIVARRCGPRGLRVDADLRNEKINLKIREHSLQKAPDLLVVGERERQAGTLAVRARGGVDLGSMTIAEFTARLTSEVHTRSDHSAV
jgi:threonyl-tRNA synthetase